MEWIGVFLLTMSVLCFGLAIYVYHTSDDIYSISEDDEGDAVNFHSSSTGINDSGS